MLQGGSAHQGTGGSVALVRSTFTVHGLIWLTIIAAVLLVATLIGGGTHLGGCSCPTTSQQLTALIADWSGRKPT